MKYKLNECSIACLLLDPNNYRFLDLEDYQPVSNKRYHEKTVQDRAYTFLKGKRYEELQALKDSIMTNGYVPLEQLIVRRYENKEELYVVIEGNRRVAAIRWILEDKDSGVEINDDLVESFKHLPIVVIDINEPENKDAVPVLMGIRHVSGIRPWGAYQQAKLISQLIEEFSLSLQEAAERLAMGAQEANRRRRAYKALEQMQVDESFSEQADPELYYKFHEVVGIPEARSWLGWSEADLIFTNEETRSIFYELITPRYDEESGHSLPAKLQTREAVRNLKRILKDDNAKDALLDPSRTFNEALSIAMATESGGWVSQVKSAISAVEGIKLKEIKLITNEDLGLMEKLRDILIERIEDKKKFI
jgi:hypothetical protein